MVSLYWIPLTTVILLVLSNMLSIEFVNLCISPLLFIGKQSSIFSAISKDLLLKVYISHPRLPISYLPILMLNGLQIQMTDSLLVVRVSFLALILSLGLLKNIQCLDLTHRSLAIAATELSWLSQLLRDHHITLSSPSRLYCDKKSAISHATNHAFHARTKHMTTTL